MAWKHETNHVQSSRPVQHVHRVTYNFVAENQAACSGKWLKVRGFQWRSAKGAPLDRKPERLYSCNGKVETTASDAKVYIDERDQTRAGKQTDKTKHKELHT